MNTETNELYGGLTQEELNELVEKIKYTCEIPKDLEHAAKIKLKGKKYAKVSFNSNGKLSKFAASKRIERRNLFKSQNR